MSHRHGVSFRLANLGGKFQLGIRLEVFVSKKYTLTPKTHKVLFVRLLSLTRNIPLGSVSDIVMVGAGYELIRFDSGSVRGFERGCG